MAHALRIRENYAEPNVTRQRRQCAIEIQLLTERGLLAIVRDPDPFRRLPSQALSADTLQPDIDGQSA